MNAPSRASMTPLRPLQVFGAMQRVVNGHGHAGTRPSVSAEAAHIVHVAEPTNARTGAPGTQTWRRPVGGAGDGVGSVEDASNG
jgi:hypothetical protein